MARNILSGDIDLGIGFNPVPHPRLEAEEIHRGHPQVVVRKDHPIFNRAKKHHYKFLKDYPVSMHIASEKIIAARPHPILKALNLEENVSFSYDNDHVALENLRHTNNWAFMVDICAAEFSDSLKTIPIPKKEMATYTIEIIKHKSRRIDAATNEIFRAIKRQVEKG